MVTVETSADIRKVDTKFLGPFTIRQTVAIAISCVYGVPLFFLLSFISDLQTRILITALAMVPTIVCGWVDMDGMKFEVFIIRYLYQSVLSSPKRKYKTINPWRTEYEKLKKAEIDNDKEKNKNTVKKKGIKQKKSAENFSPELKAYA